MGEFKLWYAYYDSLFLNAHPKVSEVFYEEHFYAEATWPTSACPSLATAFELMEAFVRESSNWVYSQCKLQQLECVEASINHLMHFITMEKSYAFAFWKIDKRRIQASLVHFYACLQLFLKAIIPYPTMTVFECKSANKLCIELTSLQKLMNDILKCVNPIARFLSVPMFAEESKIIANFFENFVSLMKKLPTIKRNKLNHVHNLAKFICLTNPIEICSRSNQNDNKIRKKSNTVGTQVDFKFQTAAADSGKMSRKSLSKKTEGKAFKRSLSSIELNKKVSNRQNTASPTPQIHQRIFRFPPRILQKAMQQQLNKKRTSLQSLGTLQNKMDSLSKKRTLTTNQTTSISLIHTTGSKEQLQRKRFKAHNSFHTTNSTKSKNKRPSNTTISINDQLHLKKRKTIFYDDQCEKDSGKLSGPSSTELTLRKRELSVISNIFHEKYVKEPKLETLCYFKTHYRICDGVLLQTRWDLVRAFVCSFIRNRRLSQLLEG